MLRCMGRYGANVMRKSTTKSTIQFEPLLLKFSMDDINSLAIPSMLMLVVSDVWLRLSYLDVLAIAESSSRAGRWTSATAACASFGTWPACSSVCI